MPSESVMLVLLCVATTSLIVGAALAARFAGPEISRTSCERRQARLGGEFELVAPEEMRLLSEYLDACVE